MSILFGSAEWQAAGREPLTEPIMAEAYMALLVERQSVYMSEHIQDSPWIKPLIEWFIWPGDDELVILPDRVTVEPKPKRMPPTREALVAKRDALQSRLDRLIDKHDKAMPARRHDTDDMAAYGGIGIRQTPRQRAKFAASLDRSIAETARLMGQVSRVRGSLARVEAQIARLR